VCKTQQVIVTFRPDSENGNRSAETILQAQSFFQRRKISRVCQASQSPLVDTGPPCNGLYRRTGITALPQQYKYMKVLKWHNFLQNVVGGHPDVTMAIDYVIR
jgi:hypothetical protein